VSQLVDLGRTRPARPAPQPLAALLESAVGVLRPWARSSSVVIEMETQAGDWRVRVDRDHMQQVLLNLLHNAVQAVSPDGRVRVLARVDAPWAVVEIADSGPGFTPDALRRAFSPFFTTKAEGTGLGLTIAKRIVEEQGGEVGVYNLDGGGGCVWIRLPLVAEAA
jgi:signal transduction histidine kinase